MKLFTSKHGSEHLLCSECDCTVEDTDYYCCQCGHKLDREVIDNPKMKFKVGDKVIPISKTADGRAKGLERSVAWMKALVEGQTYLVVERAPLNTDDYQEYCCGDYFHEKDLISYDEIKKREFV